MNPDQPQQPQQPQPNQSAPAGQPQQAPQAEQPQVVYMTRPVEPHHQDISDDVRVKHEQSLQKYPFLNLSEGEYVIFAIKRHPIGLIYIWGIVAFLVLAVIVLSAVLMAGLSSASTATQMSSGFTLSSETILVPALLVCLLAFIFGFVAAYIYTANQFFLTSESVIQHIQTSLFNRREQTISLANVEDASYSQDGIIPHLFGYGLLRLSTQGDETTYRFNYASQPARQIAILNNAVESFKNVRPISHQLANENN